MPKKIEERFNKHILPIIGDCEISSINDHLLKAKYKYLEDEGKLDTVRRVISSINELLRWCVSEGLIERVKTEYAVTRCKETSSTAPPGFRS